jgi:phosphatidate cytidylyltransferase
VEEGQEPQGIGEPVTERARIAGVEAGVAAGLIPPSEASTRPPAETGKDVPTPTSDDDQEESPSESPAAPAVPYELPDWMDPPTLQVPRVLLDLEQEAADERGGPPAAPPGGPIWRERQKDWEDTDTVIADLASDGLGVIASEESSSDDPFAYDFLGLDDEGDGIASNAAVDSGSDDADALDGASSSGAPDATSPQEPDTAGSTDESGDEETLTGEPGEAGGLPREHRRRRHVARRPRPSLPRRPVAVVRKEREGASRNPVVATLTGVVLAGLLLLCFFVGPLAVLVLAAVAVTFAAGEFFNSLRLAGYRPATLLGLVAVPALIVAAYLRGRGAIVVVFVIFIVASMVWYLARITRRSPLANLSVTVFAVAWIGVLASFAGLLLDPRVFPHRHGVAFLLGAVIVAVGYDVGGYVFGSRLGRHSLLPSVSPNKTWEGLVGGCLVTVAASAGITSQIHPWSIGTAVVLGVVVAVVAPCGDLVESMIKRDLGVKDMGSLLPGHGGVLDRIDALLFVLPAAYLVVRLVHIG